MKVHSDQLTDISDRLVVLEDEIRTISSKTTNANWSRNIIGSAIVLKLIVEGAHSIGLAELLKAFGG